MPRQRHRSIPFSEDEDGLIFMLYTLPGGREEIAEETGRSLTSIRSRAWKLGVGGGPRRDKHKVYYRQPEPQRPDLLETMVCPMCGNRLLVEKVPSGYGYIAPGKYDLVCVAGHRYQVS